MEPCFRGAAFTSPQPEEPEFETKVNRIVSVTDKDTELDMYSSKNPNTTTPAMQAVILDVTMPKDGMIRQSSTARSLNIHWANFWKVPAPIS